MLSGWGILISFWSVLVFSPTLLSLLLLLPYYYCHYCKLLLLLVITVIIIISTELLALCDGCLGWGWFPLSSKICDLGIIWSNLASKSRQQPRFPLRIYKKHFAMQLSCEKTTFLPVKPDWEKKFCGS